MTREELIIKINSILDEELLYAHNLELSCALSDLESTNLLLKEDEIKKHLRLYKIRKALISQKLTITEELILVINTLINDLKNTIPYSEEGPIKSLR